MQSGAFQPRDFGIGRLFWSIREAVIVGDVETGRIVLLSPSGETLFGYAAAELVGRPIEVLVPDRFKEAHRTGLARYGATGGGGLVGSGRAVELAALRKTGEELTIELTLTPIGREAGHGEPDDRRYMLALVRDVTERRRADEERIRRIREQAARVEAEAGRRRAGFLAEASRELVGALDHETTLARVARMAVTDVADWCTIDLATGQSIRRVGTAHADPAGDALLRELSARSLTDVGCPEAISDALRTGQSTLIPDVSPAELAAMASDPAHLDLLRRLAPRSVMIVPMAARGRVLGVITLATRSDRRFDPEDLALADDLAHRCALAADNARLVEEAREAVRIRDEFLATASHDLRSPLTAIKGMAELLRNRADRSEVPDERLIRGLNQIDEATKRMTALLDELLDTARLQAGRPLDLERAPVDLVRLVRDAADRHRATTDRHQLVVAAEVPELIGEWDARRLDRVLDNLLGNAIKFSPAGGEVTLTVAREEGEPERAVLTVQDRGVGISARDLPHIFERFRRVGNVVDKTAGTGIGLAGSCQIIRQHGGTIEATSRQGAGSTFTVRLPRVEAEGDGQEGSSGVTGSRQTSRGA